MTALTPGLYRATVRGVPEQIVILTDSSFNDPWVSPTGGDDIRWHGHEHVTDARPLIVLDLDGYTPSRIIEQLRKDRLNVIADQIEAQTKPARIPEPGLWGVVEAHLPDKSDLDDWHHRREGWHCPRHGFAAWDVLIDPVLIRGGVTP